MFICENCQTNYKEKYGSGRFCGVKCSRSFATKNKRKEINLKVSQSLLGNKNCLGHKHTTDTKAKIASGHMGRVSPLRKNNNEVFVSNSKHSRHRMKERIIKEKMIPYICQICGNDGHWLGKPISLQIDHINGVNNDNRIENLRFLCPNCHTQTETYAGKNNRRNIICQ